jgi:hypothetical protein
MAAEVMSRLCELLEAGPGARKLASGDASAVARDTACKVGFLAMLFWKDAPAMTKHKLRTSAVLVATMID